MSARSENVRTLSTLAGIAPDHADTLLDSGITITFDPSDLVQVSFAHTLQAIIERTFEHCGLEPTGDEQIEIVLGATSPRLETQRAWVAIETGTLTISSEKPLVPALTRLPTAHQVIAACYVASFVTKKLVGEGLPHIDDPKTVPLDQLPSVPSTDPVKIGTAYLAGAGAIGNAFLWTLRHFDVTGILHVYDPDRVSAGNLNRQIYFGIDDLGHEKAARLAMRAQSDFAGLKLVPHSLSLQASPAKLSDDRWLTTLIVGVDSRRARRHLQSELPMRVFDASTTGVEEIVVHFNEEPNRRACMGCIYHETPDETARERHVADALGVSLEELQQTWITPDAARRIAAKNPSVQADAIVGEAYDSLFSALCGQQLLQHSGKEVLAPFAFVSILAGAILAIEFVGRMAAPDQDKFNYWKLSPWTRPFSRLQRFRESSTRCEICKDTIYVDVRKELWG